MVILVRNVSVVGDEGFEEVGILCVVPRFAMNMMLEVEIGKLKNGSTEEQKMI